LIKYALLNLGHIIPYDSSYSFKEWADLIEEVYGLKEPKVVPITKLLNIHSGGIYRSLDGKCKIIPKRKKQRKQNKKKAVH